MKKLWIPAAVLGLLIQGPAFAIDAKYREKLERSGCTQVSEMQGCDINKTKAENAKAGFVTDAPASNANQGAAKPSFNCSKASHEIEKLVCSNGELAALDVSLSNLYSTLLKNTPDNAKKGLKTEQIGWSKGRNDCWKAADKVACTRESYQTRINELKDR